MRLPAALTIAALLALTGPVLAQTEPTKVQCYIPGPAGSGRTFLDMGLTQQHRIDAAKKDDAVMATFAGVWYGESRSPDGLFFDRTYYSFEPNGLFQYQSQTCGQVSCSQNYGTGEWVGLKEEAGQIRVIYNWSDLVLANGCAGMTGMQEGDTLMTNTGFTMQRIQKLAAPEAPNTPPTPPPVPMLVPPQQ